ncbi:MAG TPA: LLM class flavin-dependent oxidoreductase [Kribbella sp.]|nr:LLM class flavin-dependent oxidoreductase [Kribbella sp.]
MREATTAVGMCIPPTPPIGRPRMIATLARLVGLDSLFVWDHFQEFYPTNLWDRDFTWACKRPRSPHELFDYQTLLGGLAGRAGRLRLGVGVTEPIRRHPVLIAQAALTLAHLTRRAPILGIGSGERMNLEPYGLASGHPVDRLEEALVIIRRCFTSTGPIDFDGRHFRLDKAVMDLRPPPGRTPEIWVAAHGVRMLELTGRHGDGWLPTSVVLGTPGRYATCVARVRTAAGDAGRDPEDVTAALLAYIAIAPSERRAHQMVTSPLLRFWALLMPAEVWQALGADHPLGPRFRGFVDVLPQSYDRATLDAALAAVPPEIVRSGIIVGTPDHVARRLREFRDAGMRHAVLAPLSSYLSIQDYVYSGRAIQRIAHALRS